MHRINIASVNVESDRLKQSCAKTRGLLDGRAPLATRPCSRQIDREPRMSQHGGMRSVSGSDPTARRSDTLNTRPAKDRQAVSTAAGICTGAAAQKCTTGTASAYPCSTPGDPRGST